MTRSNKEIIAELRASNKAAVAKHLRSITEHRTKLANLEYLCATWIEQSTEETEEAELELIKKLEAAERRISCTRRDSGISLAYLLESATEALNAERPLVSARFKKEYEAEEGNRTQGLQAEA